MIYGYARVSTISQNLDSQIEVLNEYGVDQIISDIVSGVSLKKSNFDNLIKNLTNTDTLVVTRMDRLGRDTVQLLQLINDLEQRNIHIVILDLGIDTRTPTGKFFLTIMSGFSELERTMIKEKQRSGIKLAKEKGVYRGKPQKYTLDNQKITHAIELRKNTSKTVKEISTIVGVSEATLYRRFSEHSKSGQ